MNKLNAHIEGEFTSKQDAILALADLMASALRNLPEGVLRVSMDSGVVAIQLGGDEFRDTFSEGVQVIDLRNSGHEFLPFPYELRATTPNGAVVYCVSESGIEVGV